MEYRARTGSNVGPGMSGFVLGVLVGSVVAGSLALLYAPRSGQDLRTRIMNEVTETQQMFQTWMNDIKERAESIKLTFRTEIQKAAQASGDGHKIEDERPTG